MRDEHDRRARGGLDAQHLGLQRVARDGIECPERLVHQEDGRVRRERPCDADALLLAAREMAGIARAIPLRIERQHFEQFGDAVADLGARPAEQLRHGADILLHRPVRGKRPIDWMA